MDIQSIYNSIKETGGASYNLKNGSMNPDTGYMVANKKALGIYPKPTTFEEFRKSILDYLVSTVAWQSKIGYLGFWIHSGSMYIEMADQIMDEEEAIREGKRREQHAIWDCKNKKDIDTRVIAEMPWPEY